MIVENNAKEREETGRVIVRNMKKLLIETVPKIPRLKKNSLCQNTGFYQREMDRIGEISIHVIVIFHRARADRAAEQSIGPVDYLTSS